MVKKAEFSSVFGQIWGDGQDNYLTVMNYNNIMQSSKKGEPSFVFQMNEVEGSLAQQQIIIQKQQKSLHPNPFRMIDQELQVRSSDMAIGENLTQQIQTNLIRVQPIQPPPSIVQTEKSEINILYSSQTSESSQLEMDKEKKPEEHSYNGSIVFEYDEIEDVQLSPQSSLRKLYKNTKINEPPKIYESQFPRQKLIRIELPNRKNKGQNVDSEQEEQPNSDIDENFQEVKHKRQLKSNKIEDLILFPIPKTKMIRCLLIITNNKFFALESIFDLYLVQEKKHLLRARKKRFRIYSTFQISEKEQNSTNTVAIIRSNFTRTQYKLLRYRKEIELSERCTERQPPGAFSSDIIKIQTIADNEPPKIIEQQCSYISYESNFLGFSQQKLTMLKPKKHIAKTDRFSDIKTAFENCEYERVENFSTRMAEKGLDGKLVLDFKDKTITDSSRNMIIESQHCEAGLMFAKFSDDIYILNVMNPFNLLQGFFLGLCNIDRKPFS